MNTSSLDFKVNIPLDSLSDIFEKALDTAITSEEMEVNGVVTVLKRIDSAVFYPQGDTIFIKLPLSIHLTRSAGLFTVEGTGSLVLDLEVKYRINDSFQIKSRTELVKHEWIDKPKLEIGALNISVETLVDLVLRHHESIITAKIDNSLSGNTKVRDLVVSQNEVINQFLAKTLPPEISLATAIQRIQLSEPTTNEGVVDIDGEIDFLLAETLLEEGKEVTFQYLKESQADGIIDIPLRVGYSLFESIVIGQLQHVELAGKKIVIDSLKISAVDGLLRTEATLLEPIKGDITAICRPHFNAETQEITIEALDVKVKPANIIYKMTAPLVNRFVESKVAEHFPLNIKELLDQKLSQLIPKEISKNSILLAPTYEKVDVKHLDFKEGHLDVNLVVHQASFKLKIV